MVRFKSGRSFHFKFSNRNHHHHLAVRINSGNPGFTPGGSHIASACKPRNELFPVYSRRDTLTGDIKSTCVNVMFHPLCAFVRSLVVATNRSLQAGEFHIPEGALGASDNRWHSHVIFSLHAQASPTYHRTCITSRS